MLYPQENQVREVKSLDGIWRFKLDDGTGLSGRWYEAPLRNTISMPVPASYNDLTEDRRVRDHVGLVWYETEFYVPQAWCGQRIMLRFGSVTHKAMVWVNGKKCMEHSGGFTPFEGNVAEYVHHDRENRLTVAVDNTLGFDTVPVGKLEIKKNTPGYPDGYKELRGFFDFFNYSGIHRPVKLYTTPPEYIDDVEIVTSLEDKAGIVRYRAKVSGGCSLRVAVLDEDKQLVAAGQGLSGTLSVAHPHLWRPGHAYLYALRMELCDEEGNLLDTYSETFGIRTVEVKDKEFLINGERFYFKGFGKHEDFLLSGRGLNEIANVKDFSLMKWIGANSFRTSHYPYSEELMRLADREGLVVIDEVPAVGLELRFGQALAGGRGQNLNTWEQLRCAAAHRQAIQEMIARDKNHPCVVMWSVANEPATDEAGAYEYFKPLCDLARELDPAKRPVTIVQHMFSTPKNTQVRGLCDVIALNRYYGWYAQSGNLDAAKALLRAELQAWWEAEEKPVMMCEYGADTLHGLTSTIPVMWSEEYQCELLNCYHEVFDELDFVIGEHVWNFADFMTGQGIIRVNGNKKGVFTRERAPKMAAYLLRQRWRSKQEEPA